MTPVAREQCVDDQNSPIYELAAWMYLFENTVTLIVQFTQN